METIVKTKKKAEVIPFKHQTDAVDATLTYFDDKNNTRGKIIMPCGSGKTMTAFWIVENIKVNGYKKIIITVPNLILQRQTLKTFYSSLSDSYKFMCVGSDNELNDGFDSENNIISITTDYKEMSSFLNINKSKNVIIVATYQSIETISQACNETDFIFNLGVIDEAHRTVGAEGKLFGKILYDDNINIEKRIFLTATEKIYVGSKDEISSMDNISLYGDMIFKYPLSKAIEDKVLCDYKVCTIYSTKEEVYNFIKSNSYLDYNNLELTDIEKERLICSLISTIKAITDKGRKKIITYHSTIKKAKIFQRLLEQVINNRHLNIGVYHINGNQSNNEKFKQIESFEKSFISVLTNSKALVEGVDMPCVDCVLYSDKKESTIEITQSLGRSIRKFKGKNFSYVIVPILTSSKEDVNIHNSEFAGMFNILIALYLSDEYFFDNPMSLGKSLLNNNSKLEHDFELDNAFKDYIIDLVSAIKIKIHKKLKGGWTKENCIEVAKKYKASSEWYTKSKDSYSAACYHGWLAECCSHMIPLKKPNSYYTKEICIDNAKKYKTKKEWMAKSQSYYLAAGRIGCRDECCAHMELMMKPNGYWTKERCIEDAKKYKTKTEWQLKSGSAYNRAGTKGWINDCCTHMNNRLKITKELCIRDAKQFKTKTEWRMASSSNASVAFKSGWFDECCSHMIQTKYPNGYWTKERCIEDAKKYKTRKEWWAKSPSGISIATRNGWLDKCCNHMIQIKKPRGYWTKERCIESAKKYKTRNRWQKSGKGYDAARLNKWLDECCKHMKKNTQ